VSAGEDKEKRAAWYGKMVTPPKDGKHGEWTLPHWKDYEHVAGLGLAHDMWQVGGNDLQLPSAVLDEIERRMLWDDKVKFIGYWELGDALRVEGGVPERIVCSVFCRPAHSVAPHRLDFGDEEIDKMMPFGQFHVAENVKSFLRAAGKNKRGWLILAPFNNSDDDVTITLRPNLAKLGFAQQENGQWRDVYRMFDGAWQAPPGWLPNVGDPEPPYIAIKGQDAMFPMKDGVATIPIPKRNFRMLLLQPSR